MVRSNIRTLFFLKTRNKLFMDISSGETPFGRLEDGVALLLLVFVEIESFSGSMANKFLAK